MDAVSFCTGLLKAGGDMSRATFHPAFFDMPFCFAILKVDIIPCHLISLAFLKLVWCVNKCSTSLPAEIVTGGSYHHLKRGLYYFITLKLYKLSI